MYLNNIASKFRWSNSILDEVTLGQTLFANHYSQLCIPMEEWDESDPRIQQILQKPWPFLYIKTLTRPLSNKLSKV